MESLQPEVAPFGINTTLIEPGFFRTDLLSNKSTTYSSRSIEDYKERREILLGWWKTQAGKQTNDPVKLADALIKIASEEKPPRRFMAGADSVASAKQKAADLQAQSEAYLELSSSMAHA